MRQKYFLCLRQLLTMWPAVQMFERETSREKNLEKAAKEAKIKARKEAGKGNDVVEKKMTEADLQQVPPPPSSPSLWHSSVLLLHHRITAPSLSATT